MTLLNALFGAKEKEIKVVEIMEEVDPQETKETPKEQQPNNKAAPMASDLVTRSITVNSSTKAAEYIDGQTIFRTFEDGTEVVLEGKVGTYGPIVAKLLMVATSIIISYKTAIEEGEEGTAYPWGEIKDGGVILRIPLFNLMETFGYNCIKDPKTAQEKKSNKATRDNSRKKAISLVKTFGGLSVTLKNKDSLDWKMINILRTGEIKDNVLILHINSEYIDHIFKKDQQDNNMRLFYFPIELLSIPDTKPNVLKLLCRICQHASQKNNQRIGTDKTLGVATVLKDLSHPTIEEVRAKKKGYIDRIRRPLERDYDDLVNYGVISGWSYTLNKKKVKRDAALKYEDWIKLKITVKDLKDQRIHKKEKNTDKTPKGTK